MSITLNAKVQRTAIVDEAVRQFLGRGYEAKQGKTRGKRVKSKAYLEAREKAVKKWLASTEA